MTSRIRRSLATMVPPHRYTVFLLVGGIMILVSSFSTLPPTRSPKQSHRNGVCSLNNHLTTKNSHRQLLFTRSTSRRSRLLSMTSPVTATEDSEQVRELFSKYCDENFLIDRKTLESMPPVVDMLVS